MNLAERNLANVCNSESKKKMMFAAKVKITSSSKDAMDGNKSDT